MPRTAGPWGNARRDADEVELARGRTLAAPLLCSHRRYVFGAIASAATGLMLVFESMMHRVAAVLMKLLGIKQQEQVAVDLDGDGEASH